MPLVSTRPQCLLLMPLQGQFAAVRETITTALQQAGIDPISPQMQVLTQSSMLDVIQAAIDRADLIIVDITGSNPNVMFELGFSLGRGKMVLPIVSRTVSSVPLGLDGALYLVYDASDLATLSRNIKYWSVRYLEQSGSLVGR